MELLIALLLAQTTATLAAPRKYYLVDQQATWAEARSYCRERFGDLATIENGEDMERVENMLADSGVDWAWIGLYDDVDSWRWSLDSTFLYAAGNTGFGDWMVFNANNGNGNENCVALNKGKLADNGCGADRLPICYDEPSNTYTIVNNSKTWTEAQRYCREMHTDLASIRNYNEKQSIVPLTVSTERYWTGLYREGWKWSDQSGSTFIKWAGGEPTGGSENRAFASVDGIHDAPSDYVLPFICSAPVQMTVKMVVKSNGNLDLNNPVIQEAILNQVEKDIKKLGIQQKIRVTWNKQPTGKVFTLTTQP